MVTVKFPCIWLSELMVTVTFPCIWLAKLMASGNISFYLIGWTDGQWQPFFLSDCLSWWPKATFLIIWLSELMATVTFPCIWLSELMATAAFPFIWFSQAMANDKKSLYLIGGDDGQQQHFLFCEAAIVTVPLTWFAVKAVIATIPSTWFAYSLISLLSIYPEKNYHPSINCFLWLFNPIIRVVISPN